MVITPRLPLERGKYAGLRDDGRSLWPEKSAETLPPEKGARKLVEKEALGEKEDELRMGFTAMGGDSKGRWSAKLEAVVTTATIASS